MHTNTTVYDLEKMKNVLQCAEYSVRRAVSENPCHIIPQERICWKGSPRGGSGLNTYTRFVFNQRMSTFQRLLQKTDLEGFGPPSLTELF